MLLFAAAAAAVGEPRQTGLPQSSSAMATRGQPQQHKQEQVCGGQRQLAGRWLPLSLCLFALAALLVLSVAIAGTPIPLLIQVTPF